MRVIANEAMRRSDRKRSHRENSSSSSSSKIDKRKKLDHDYRHHHHHHNSAASNLSIDNHVAAHSNSFHEAPVLHSNSVPHSEVPSLYPKVKILCEILAKNPAASVENILEDTGIRVTEKDVEEVLRSSYRYPGAAVKFFRWSSFQLNNKHGLYSWNLVVDLLGKNCLFDAMWDAIKSMRKELLLSLSTFASVFSNYVIANRVQEAIMCFDVLDNYGVPRDVVALNSLLRAICSKGRTQDAMEFFKIVKEKIRVDVETYLILLEGYERERDVSRARQTLSEMVMDIGWDKRNVPAYDSVLCTMLKGSEGMREVLKLFDTMSDRGCYPGMKFFKFAIDECVRKSDARSAKIVWDTMVGKNNCQPDTALYKSLISLHCSVKDFDSAGKLLDEMVYNGAFPDSETYGLVFHSLIKHRHLREAIPLFKEMMKNEFVPMLQDCIIAVKAYVDAGDAYMAIKVWRCMLENYRSDLDETGNLLVVGLRDMDMVPEAVKYAEDIIERGIKLNSATLSKLKQSLSKVGKAFAYEELLRKWKSY